MGVLMGPSTTNVSRHKRTQGYFATFVHLGSKIRSMSADKATENKPKIDLGLLEEDDEFEEFPSEDWGAAEEDAEDVNVWEDNWDDDNIEDDFSQQLRAELNVQPMQ